MSEANADHYSRFQHQADGAEVQSIQSWPSMYLFSRCPQSFGVRAQQLQYDLSQSQPSVRRPGEQSSEALIDAGKRPLAVLGPLPIAIQTTGAQPSCLQPEIFISQHASGRYSNIASVPPVVSYHTTDPTFRSPRYIEGTTIDPGFLNINCYDLRDKSGRSCQNSQMSKISQMSQQRANCSNTNHPGFDENSCIDPAIISRNKLELEWDAFASCDKTILQCDDFSDWGKVANSQCPPSSIKGKGEAQKRRRKPSKYGGNVHSANRHDQLVAKAAQHELNVKFRCAVLCGNNCQTPFKNALELAQHLDTSHGLDYRGFWCKEIDCVWSVLGFHSAQQLLRHNKGCHVCDVFVCPQCHRKFNYSWSQVRHMKNESCTSKYRGNRCYS